MNGPRTALVLNSAMALPSELALGCGVLFEGIDSDDQERMRAYVGRRATRFTV